MKKTLESPQSALMVGTLLAAIAGCATEAQAAVPKCYDENGNYKFGTPPKYEYIKKNGKGNIICLVDGDTFDVITENRKRVRIRLWGVDCAESTNNEKCQSQNCDPRVGQRAARQVQALLGNRGVQLQGPYKNNGDRKLAYIHLLKNGVDLGRQMIKQCICKEDYRHKRKRDYKKVAKGCK